MPNAKMSRQAGCHGDDRRQIPAVEATLGEPPGNERGQRIGHQKAACRTEQAEEPLREHGARGKDRQPGDTGQQVNHLAGHPEPGAERGTADEHDHRLKREWHGRERQRNADLRGNGGQHGDKDHGRRPNRARHVGA